MNAGPRGGFPTIVSWPAIIFALLAFSGTSPTTPSPHEPEHTNSRPFTANEALPPKVAQAALFDAKLVLRLLLGDEANKTLTQNINTRFPEGIYFEYSVGSQSEEPQNGLVQHDFGFLDGRAGVKIDTSDTKLRLIFFANESAYVDLSSHQRFIGVGEQQLTDQVPKDVSSDFAALALTAIVPLAATTQALDGKPPSHANSAAKKGRYEKLLREVPEALGRKLSPYPFAALLGAHLFDPSQNIHKYIADKELKNTISKIQDSLLSLAGVKGAEREAALKYLRDNRHDMQLFFQTDQRETDVPSSEAFALPPNIQLTDPHGVEKPVSPVQVPDFPCDPPQPDTVYPYGELKRAPDYNRYKVVDRQQAKPGSFHPPGGNVPVVVIRSSQPPSQQSPPQESSCPPAGYRPPQGGASARPGALGAAAGTLTRLA